MIGLDHVSKVYGSGDDEVRALDDISLSVVRGEFVAVRGSSGSGKSTFLLAVGGMIRPTSGTVQVDGGDLYGMSGTARARLRAERIGFVFQMFHLVPYLSAIENVLATRLVGASVSRAEATAMLERLDLGHRIKHLPSELSTGERQRVALARALIKKPDILLADEPTGNLDPTNSRQVMEHFAAFHEAGGTVVVVTHEPEVEEFSQRTLHLEDGRLSGD